VARKVTAMAIRLAHHLHAELVGVSPIRGRSSQIRTEERKQMQREKQTEAVTWTRGATILQTRSQGGKGMDGLLSGMFYC